MSYEELITEVFELPIGKRMDIISRILKSILLDCRAITAEDRFQQIKTFAENTFQKELENKRKRDDVLVRSFISYIMYNEGFSLSTIGRFMKRDHSTVLYMVNKVKDMLSLPGFYAEDLKKLNKIITLLNESKIQETDEGSGDSYEGSSE